MLKFNQKMMKEIKISKRSQNLKCYIPLEETGESEPTETEEIDQLLRETMIPILAPKEILKKTLKN